MPDTPDQTAAIAGLGGWIESRLIGRSPLVERLLIGLLTGGHVLVEGIPGLAKTRAVRLLADGVEARFARIQCTPDLMPADLTGTPVFRPDSGRFEFMPGPVFNSIVLVDEINRAPPKVQSALLEGMAEGQVTVAGETRALPDPFMVVATQNPIEHEGTFPLPEAQLDRFLFHVIVTPPGLEDERRILDLVETEAEGEAVPDLRLGPGALSEARAAVRQVHASPALKDYIVALVTATRDPEQCPEIAHPISPRGSLALLAGARARAWLDGRDHAIPEDVAALAPDALAHRLVLGWRAEADGATARGVIDGLLARIEPL
ncbi:MAG: AAA family ATPase [Pseudomonadota bacterium]